MATFKHISSKNADYGAAEAYLTFEHDEFTMKPTLDENGRLIPREDYRISSLNCGGEDFAVACMRANLRYEKNQKREDVKSHHYIISFDPRDGTDNGLTVDRAQELGEQFCKEHFPGHQALICTHPDGHNHSGNIHVHIVINSLRIYEVPLLPYMDRPADTREGCKHRCTNAAMEYFKSEVMEMCHREGLYQIDLLNGSKERITEREYWAAKKGQLALDKENAAREAAGQPTKPTKFETDKAKLRRTIRQALSQAGSFDEFSSLLLREGVTVKESRGRLSYLTPDRTKPITARKLGDDFDKAAVLALLTQNAHRAAEQTKAIPEYPAAVKKPLQGEKAAKTTPADNTLQRMVDREAKRAEGKGVGYDRWAAKHNLKQMAATVTAYHPFAEERLAGQRGADIRHGDKVASLVLVGAQYKVPTLLIDFQNLLFRCMPGKSFENMGLSKIDTIKLSHSMRSLDFTPQLNRVTCPVTIVCGEKDSANLKASKKLNELLPQATLQIVPGVGHEINKDAPEVIADILNNN